MSLVFLMISSCKKDDPNQNIETLANTPFQYQLEFDGQTYSATDGVNGYKNYSSIYGNTLQDSIEWGQYSWLTANDPSVSLGIFRSTFKPLGSTYTMDDLRREYYPGVHTYSNNPDSGISVSFRNNDEYFSNLGTDQFNSNFVIEDTISGSDYMGPYLKIKARFNCKVYELINRDQHLITNGVIICKLQPPQ